MNLSRRPLPLFLGAAIALATVLNGLGAYFKRIGVLERERYEAYWLAHCGIAGTTDAPLGIGRRCLARDRSASSREVYRRERPLARYVHEVRTYELPLKAAKDVVVLALIGALLRRTRRLSTLPGLFRNAGPATGLLCLAGLAALATGVRDPLPAAAGLRSLVFLAVAFGATLSVVPLRLEGIAAALPPLLGLQVALTVPELLYGLPLYWHLPVLDLPQRMAGTLVLPNSLGVLAVTALAFCVSFANRLRLFASAAALVLVVVAGSATGLIVLLALAGIWLVRRATGQRRLRLAGVLVIASALVTVTLPAVLNRPELFDSLWSESGRWAGLQRALPRDGREAVFGRGLGAGTNTWANLSGQAGETQALGASAAAPRFADSTLTALLLQLGLFGPLLFYGTILWASWRDASAWPFYLAVTLTSFTLNITELFPTNILLGLALARAFHTGPAAETELSE